MRRPLRLTTVAAVLVMAALPLLATTASAGGNTQLSGTGFPDDASKSNCGAPPAGYESFVDFNIVLEGDIVGCLYTDVDLDSAKVTKGNVYSERGREVIVGCVDGKCGTIETTYKFTSKWAGEPFASPQLWGRCQHPFVTGSGTGGLEGATGRINFEDDVVEGDFDYKGHIKFANAG